MQVMWIDNLLLGFLPSLYCKLQSFTFEYENLVLIIVDTTTWCIKYIFCSIGFKSIDLYVSTTINSNVQGLIGMH